MRGKGCIYLAGPITGCSYTECTDWRAHFQNLVSHRCLDPLRGKAFLREEKDMSGEWPNPLTTAKGIMSRDFFDAHRCDVLVVNFLDCKIVSIGTCFEIAWCHAKRTPIVLVMENHGNIHDHLFVTEACGFRVDTLEAAAKVVKEILG